MKDRIHISGDEFLPCVLAQSALGLYHRRLRCRMQWNHGKLKIARLL